MENIEAFDKFTGNSNPVTKLVPDAGVHPSEVLIDEEREMKEKLEKEDRPNIIN